MSIKNNTTSLQNLLEMVNNLPDVNEGGSGVELPELSNEGSATDLLSGKQLINGNGNIITGTFSIDAELDTQDDLIAQIQDVVNDLPEANNGIELPTLTNAGTASDLLSGKQLIDGDGNVVTGNFTIDNELSTQDNLLTQLRNAMVGKAASSGSGQIVPLTVSASGTYDASNYIPFNTEIPFKNVIDKENIESLEYTMDDLMEGWGDYVAGVFIGNAIFGGALSHNGYLSDGEYGIEVYVATGQCLLYGESIGWINPETGEPTSAPSFELTNGIMERNYQTNPYLCAMLNMPLAYNPVTVSGSGEYEIYTLNVELSYPSICTTIICTTLNNGIISMYHNQLKPSDKNSLQNFTIENVLCGSPVIVTENSWDDIISTNNLIYIGWYPIDMDTNLSSTNGFSIYCNATSSDASIRIEGGLEE